MRFVGEMEQDVGQLHVPMHDIVLLHISNALDKLPQYNPRLILSQGLALLKQSGQVKAISVFLEHVYFLRSLDRLVMFDSIVAAYHAMNLDLLEDVLHIFVREAFRVKNLACIDSLRCVDCRAYHWCISRPSVRFFEQVCRELCLDDCSELALSNDLVVKDDVAVHFTHFFTPLRHTRS